MVPPYSTDKVASIMDRSSRGLWKMRPGAGGPRDWSKMSPIRVTKVELDDGCDGRWRVHFQSLADQKEQSGSILWFSPDYGSYCWEPDHASKAGVSHYPHVCPRCAKPAYVGACGGGDVDCTNNDCPTRKR